MNAASATRAIEAARAAPFVGGAKFDPDMLRSMRDRLELTQRDLAELVQVSPTTIASWESGSTKPTLENMGALSAVREMTEAEVNSALGREGLSRPLSADEIRAIRLRLGVSQAKFGKLLGVSTNTVSGWEKGRTSPRERSLRAINELAVGKPIDASHARFVGAPEGTNTVPEKAPDKEQLTPEDIARIRADAGLSQSAMARKIGVSVNTIGNWENGHSHPRGSNLQKLLEMR
jgi:DNA-binding transcriptional regulator YiaG